MNKNYDFSGWATKSNIPCSDGRMIMVDAFKHNNGITVPLVWNHDHNGPDHVLGHALLENRDEGVYAYCSFNETESGQTAKKLVEHGDVRSLSIYANQLKQQGGNVTHGQIREVSLVLAGANPGARIVDVMSHSDDEEDCAYITADAGLEMRHAEEKKEEKPAEKPEEKGDGKTIGDVYNAMTDEQKTVVHALVGQALAEARGDNKDNDEEDSNMKHNVFDNEEQKQDDVLSHSDIEEIFADAKRSGHGSLRDECLAHGVTNIEYLFPDAQNVTKTPQFIDRDTGWVSVVMSGVHHTPFSRIKSTFADITGEEARARGYIKGKEKQDEVFTLLKRTTDPQTIYKKQKLDRDDIIDITDFDAAAWVKSEMRGKLDEEIARAILIGDGRNTSSDDHIKHDRVRPIAFDADLYTIKYEMEAAETDSDFVDACVLAQDDYDGSGNTTAFMEQKQLTRCLLLKDLNGHRLYKDVNELATAMLVKKIVTVPVMKGLKDETNQPIKAIIVDLNDYNVGADKGGAVQMFEDFDIDFNAEKYLIETRISGAMIRPKAAVVIKQKLA